MSPQETALDHISVVNAYSIHKVLQELDSLLQKDPNTPNTSQPPSLVILDSLGAVITPVLGGARNLQGHAVLSTCAMLLKQVAAQLKSVVIVSNHVVRGFAPYQDNAQHRFREKSQPALGFSWQHQAHLRLELSMASANDSGGGGSDFGGSLYILSKITKNRRLSMKYSTYLPVSGRYIDVEVSEAGLTASSTF